MIMVDDLRPEDTWPTVVFVEAYEPRLCVSDLTQDEKKLLWDHLRESHPAIAHELASIAKDPLVKELINGFGAGFCIQKKYTPEVLMAKLEDN